MRQRTWVMVLAVAFVVVGIAAVRSYRSETTRPSSEAMTAFAASCEMQLTFTAMMETRPSPRATTALDDDLKTARAGAYAICPAMQQTFEASR